MKRTGQKILIFMTLLLCVLQSAQAAPEQLVAVGQTVGIHLDAGVTVVDFETGCSADAQIAGIRKGDKILSIDGTPVRSMEQVRQCVGQDRVHVLVERGGKHLEFLLHPCQTENGWRLGLRVRDGITGIGTITFYDPETGAFGALGHSINEPETGTLMNMTGGSIMAASVQQVTRGAVGAPGELRGSFSPAARMGSVRKNTACGIFGTLDEVPQDAPIPVASISAVQPGEAEIISNVSGTQRSRYKVEILKIQPQDSEGRSFLLRVTDPDLLTRTGGIVQGMSGSPIIQNGQLIGAVTHVLVNDPTSGYGIFIENMLEAAG